MKKWFKRIFRSILRKICGIKRYDRRGFDHNGIHKNGTKYDDLGFNCYGYDKEGYNYYGYNELGKNRNGQYDRLHDLTSGDEEGFYDLAQYPISLSKHVILERLPERLGINNVDEMYQLVEKAYRYGRSKRQIKQSSSYLIEEIEQRGNGRVVLIYNGFVYIFSYDNALITVYKNERIPL